MKRIVSMLLALLLCASFAFGAGTQALAYDSGEDRPSIVICEDIIVGDLLNIGNGYSCSVMKIPVSKAASGYTDKVKSVVFADILSHEKLDVLASFEVTASGMYSPVDKTSVITGLEVSYNGAPDGITFEKIVDLDCACLVISYCGVQIATLNYRISYNGNIEQS